MKEVPLSDTPVDRLVAEIERTGETIVLTRDGKPAATLRPAVRTPTDTSVMTITRSRAASAARFAESCDAVPCLEAAPEAILIGQ